jgi:ferritin-like metal-binding protein YciE
MNNLQELFHHMLMDVYYAEQKILKSLPKMAKKASDKTLTEAFESHREETEKQLERLNDVFAMLKEKPKGETCEALDGLVAEAEEILADAKTDAVRDAGLLAAAQAVEHYEIARYGTLVAWAKEIGLKGAADVLQQTLDEEYAANDKLDKLAAKRINKQAA